MPLIHRDRCFNTYSHRTLLVSRLEYVNASDAHIVSLRGSCGSVERI